MSHIHHGVPAGNVTPMTDEEIMVIWWSNHAALQSIGADHDRIRIRFARQVRGEVSITREDLLCGLLRQAITIMEMHRDLHGGKFFPALPGFIDECNRVVNREGT